MGHMVGKDIYAALGEKIDGLPMRTPQTETFYKVLRALYSAEDAELIVKMPFALSTIDRIAQVTGVDRADLESRLAALCDKGLMVDVLLSDGYRYMPAPYAIGFFEFTMMRMHDSDPDIGKIAKLFSDYFHEGDFYAANCRDGQQVTVLRAGAGGMAAQVSFGARSGGAPIILGSILIVLALAFSDSLAVLLRLFPQPALGVMLFLAGLQLALGSCDFARDKGERFVTLAPPHWRYGTSASLSCFRHCAAVCGAARLATAVTDGACLSPRAVS